MRPKPPLAIAVALAAVPALGAPSSAAHARQDAPPAQGEAPQAIERLKEWPELERPRDAVELDVQRLRKARTPEMAGEASAALAAGSSGAAPLLLAALGKERDEEAVRRLETVLEALTDARHTRLLARSFADRAQAVRIWALERCARFPDAGVREPALKALAKARKAVAGEPDDRDAQAELYAAALCATSAGCADGLDALLPWVEEDWSRRGEELRTALEGARGPEATAFASRLLASPERREVLAGLHLIAGCGERPAAEAVRPFLDEDDNALRIAAINAMRGIVDGDPPLDKLPVFQAIELAKQWKARR